MIRINLLPVREERRKADLRQFVALLLATLLGTVALLGFFHWTLSNDIAATKVAIAQTQRQIDAFGPQLQQVEQYRKTKAQIEKKLEVIADLEAQRSGPVRMLDELATHTPDRLWITRVAATGRSITIQGMSLDNEIVALFMTALNGSPYFTSVELRQTQAKDVSGFKLHEFELNAALRSPAAEQKAAEEESTQAASSGGPRLAAAGR
jgi:type IV pilus assembly protein PilN